MILEYKGFHPVLGGGRVYGGPFREIAESHRSYASNDVLTVKMAAEIDAPCGVDVPTVDFSLPRDKDMIPALKAAINAMIDGKAIYAGCMSGTGRTGLFFGCLTAVLRKGVDPVGVVRAGYKPHAIETKDQQEYVRKFTRRHTWFTRRQRLKVGMVNVVRKIRLISACTI